MRACSGTAADPALLVVNVTVTDCEITDGGHVIEAGVGVFVQQAAFINVVHNSVHHFYYTAVSTGWTWGYAATSNEHLNVSYNLLHDVFQGRLSDGGCIYNLGISPGSVFDHNICHDVVSFGYGGWGYYDDEGSSQVRVGRAHAALHVHARFLAFSFAQLLWTNNIVFNTKSGGLHQHYGLYNTWKNNVFAFPDVASCDGAGNCDNAAVRSSQWPPGAGQGDVSEFTFTNNIVLLRNASATLFFSSMATAFVNMTFDWNVYWSEGVCVRASRFGLQRVGVV